MSLVLILVVSALALFVVEAIQHRSLVAAGLACLAAVELLARL